MWHRYIPARFVLFNGRHLLMKLDSVPKAGPKENSAPLDTPSTYQVEGRTFVVQPVFQETGETSLAALLLNLMRADASFK